MIKRLALFLAAVVIIFSSFAWYKHNMSDPTLQGAQQFDQFGMVKTFLGSYTITASDYSNGYANFSFAHNLNFKPTVLASFINTTDGVSRELPYFYQSPAQSYYQTDAPGSDFHVASYSVQIYSIDTTNINISLKIHDTVGLGMLAANTVLNFKFICIRDAIL